MTELLAGARLLCLQTPAHRLASELDYLDMVDRGLPIKSLGRIVAAIAPTDSSLKYLIVPKASLARRRAGKRLSTAQSVVVIRLASVWAQAIRIWKSQAAARDFLYRKHPLLGERRPIDLMLENELGAELVRGILGRLEHGASCVTAQETRADSELLSIWRTAHSELRIHVLEITYLLLPCL
jgi:putative toxin-antitoxin system antitoxin component (TIGR02293 family)